MPPRQVLNWDQVVKYAFLSDFDLLCDARQDVQRKPWATPAARLAIDKAFKLERAEEEVAQLNIEVPCLATYICDKDIYLHRKEAELLLSHPALALQVSLYWMERGRFNAHHLKVLGKIYLLAGYTGPIGAGKYSCCTGSHDIRGARCKWGASDSGSSPYRYQPRHEMDLEEELDEEQAGEDEEIEVSVAERSTLAHFGSSRLS